jgi:glycerol-3-phosphate dehydrogenase
MEEASARRPSFLREEPGSRRRIVDAGRDARFRTRPVEDIRGVELCATVKNIIAGHRHR